MYRKSRTICAVGLEIRWVTSHDYYNRLLLQAIYKPISKLWPCSTLADIRPYDRMQRCCNALFTPSCVSRTTQALGLLPCQPLYTYLLKNSKTSCWGRRSGHCLPRICGCLLEATIIFSAPAISCKWAKMASASMRPLHNRRMNCSVLLP